MEENFERLRNLYIQTIGNCKQSELDKPYMGCAAGSFTRREIIEEVKNNTEFGKQQLDKILNFAIYLLEQESQKEKK